MASFLDKVKLSCIKIQQTHWLNLMLMFALNNLTLNTCCIMRMIHECKHDVSLAEGKLINRVDSYTD